MGPRLLVCISSAGASVALWRGRLVQARRYELGEEGEAAFAQLLATVSNVPVVFMVDSVDEDYRFETLPHTLGRDRQELLGRKLRQLYRNTPFVSARLQERERDNRRDDRFLFMAVTDLDIIEPWVSPVIAQGLPIVGLFALPTVTPAAIAALKLKVPDLLVVSRHVSGLRQTFIKDGRFRFSRLTPLRGLPEDNLDLAFATEITNPRLYLNALQAATADSAVDVVLLDQDDSMRGLQARLLQNPGILRPQRVSRAQLRALLKIAPEASDATPDALHLQLLGMATPTDNLAPAELLQGFSVHRAGRFLYAAAGIIAAVGVLWFAIDINRVRNLEDETTSAAQQTRRYDDLYAEITRSFPASPVSAASLRQTVDAFERLRTRAGTPEPLHAVLGDALANHPAVNLRALSWRHGPFTDAASVASKGLTPGAGGAPHQGGHLQAEIQPFSGDYRSAVNEIREFADTLRAHPRVQEVKLLKLPRDDSSRQSLTGSTSAQAEAQVGARFELVLLLKDEEGGR
jgi:hypothetical protein